MPGRDTAEQAQLLKIVFWLAGPMLIIGAMTIWFAARRFDLPGPVVLLLFVGLLPATWGLILLVEHATTRASHGLVTALHAGHAASPEPGFSRQEALVAQGRPSRTGCTWPTIRTTSRRWWRSAACWRAPSPIPTAP